MKCGPSARGLGSWAACAVLALNLGACGGNSGLAPVGRATTDDRSSKTKHVVQRGDTLYSIAWQYGFDYADIARWNNIREPFTIFPGQALSIQQPSGDSPAYTVSLPVQNKPSKLQTLPAPQPRTNAKQPLETATTIPRSVERVETSAASSKPSKKQAPKPEVNVPSSPAVGEWRWPTKGKLIGSFGDAGLKGVDIAGRLGQPVVAAADGKVVYSGGGLIGYGELIIVKHDKQYLSAYAHNSKVLVPEGAVVKGGQQIAEMGRTGADRVKLHFEIRRNGQPVNPISFLPKL